MEDIFRSYWWLLFPLSWFVIGGWNSWLHYRRSKDAMDLMRQYAAQGKEPPAELLKTVSPAMDDYGWYGRRRYRYGYYGGYRGSWQARVVLFGLLSAGFGYAAFIDMYGAGEGFTIVAFVTGALAVATLVGGVLTSLSPTDHDDPANPRP